MYLCIYKVFKNNFNKYVKFLERYYKIYFIERY